jgi:putative membrane protein
MPDTTATSNTGLLLRQVTGTLTFVAIGIVTFLIAFFIITKITPFSIRKEIEDDQNTSLAILIGAVLLGLAQIIAAAIHG